VTASSPRPIEAFMIRLSDGSTWAVKGCLHPEGRVVAVPKRGWWGRAKTMGASLGIVRRYYLHYLVRLPTGDTAPAVPYDEIDDVMEPSRKCPSGMLGRVCRALLSLLSDCGECGVTGSLLSGEWVPESDVDIVCYGVSDPVRCLAAVSGSTEFSVFSRFASVEVASVAEGMPRATHEALISERLLQGLFMGVPYTLKFVDCSRDPFIGADVVRAWRVPKLFFEVVDDERRYFTPVTYGAWTDRLGEVTLYSLRTRWCELHSGTVGLLRDASVYELGDGAIVVNLDRSFAESVLL